MNEATNIYDDDDVASVLSEFLWETAAANNTSPVTVNETENISQLLISINN